MRDFQEDGCYCDFVTFKPCPYCIIGNKKIEINSEEKIITSIYKRLLLSNKRIPSEIVSRVNEIHEKYSNFSMFEID